MLLLQIEVSNHSLQFQNVTDHAELDMEEEDESNLWQLRKAENWKFLIFFVCQNLLFANFDNIW